MAKSAPARHTTPAKRLTAWAKDVARLRKHALHTLDPERVHDLRVALRRCRTVAERMRTTSDGHNWRKLDKRATQLLHALGELRDSQVHGALIAKGSAQHSKFRERIDRSLSDDEKAAVARASRELRRFDVAEWRRLVSRAGADRTVRALTRGRARRIVARTWIEAADAHEEALRANDPATWHAARIAWKKFRYCLEAFAPDLNGQWGAEVAEMQTELGDAHDLDSLAAFLQAHARNADRRQLRSWLAAIHVQRESRISSYKRRTRGLRAAWRSWGEAALAARVVNPAVRSGADPGASAP